MQNNHRKVLLDAMEPMVLAAGQYQPITAQLIEQKAKMVIRIANEDNWFNSPVSTFVSEADLVLTAQNRFM